MHKRAAATVVTSDGSLKMDRRTKTHTRTPGRLVEARDTCGLVFAVCSVSTRLYRKRYKLAWHCLFVCLFISLSANMFRSGRPQIGCPNPQPHPTPTHTRYSCRLLRKELVSQNQVRLSVRENPALQYRSATTWGPFPLCVPPDGLGHDVMPSSSVFP